jgi:hypothetical protein
MASYNLKYAQSIDELKDKAADITTTGVDGLSDDKLNAILDLVSGDEYTWASAAWFLSSECGDSVRSQLRQGTVAGYTAYMGCIGTPMTEDRVAYWTRAKAAFGLP